MLSPIQGTPRLCLGICRGRRTDGRTGTPRSLTVPRHQVAEEQGQGQRRRQQPHPCHLPRPATGGFLYNQPPPGISQAGKRRGAGKKAAPLFDFPAVASPRCTWPPPKKAKPTVATSQNLPFALCFLTEKRRRPPPSSAPHPMKGGLAPLSTPPNPDTPQEGMQVTVTENYRFYWTR